jgi:hypothetical protein
MAAAEERGDLYKPDPDPSLSLAFPEDHTTRYEHHFVENDGAVTYWGVPPYRGNGGAYAARTSMYNEDLRRYVPIPPGYTCPWWKEPELWETNSATSKTITALTRDPGNNGRSDFAASGAILTEVPPGEDFGSDFEEWNGIDLVGPSGKEEEEWGGIPVEDHADEEEEEWGGILVDDHTDEAGQSVEGEETPSQQSDDAMVEDEDSGSDWCEKRQAIERKRAHQRTLGCPHSDMEEEDAEDFSEMMELCDEAEG